MQTPGSAALLERLTASVGWLSGLMVELGVGAAAVALVFYVVWKVVDARADNWKSQKALERELRKQAVTSRRREARGLSQRLDEIRFRLSESWTPAGLMNVFAEVEAVKRAERDLKKLGHDDEAQMLAEAFARACKANLDVTTVAEGGESRAQRTMQALESGRLHQVLAAWREARDELVRVLEELVVSVHRSASG